MMKSNYPWWAFLGVRIQGPCVGTPRSRKLEAGVFKVWQQI